MPPNASPTARDIVNIPEDTSRHPAHDKQDHFDSVKESIIENVGSVMEESIQRSVSDSATSRVTSNDLVLEQQDSGLDAGLGQSHEILDETEAEMVGMGSEQHAEAVVSYGEQAVASGKDRAPDDPDLRHPAARAAQQILGKRRHESEAGQPAKKSGKYIFRPYEVTFDRDANGNIIAIKPKDPAADGSNMAVDFGEGRYIFVGEPATQRGSEMIKRLSEYAHLHSSSGMVNFGAAPVGDTGFSDHLDSFIARFGNDAQDQN